MSYVNRLSVVWESIWGLPILSARFSREDRLQDLLGKEKAGSIAIPGQDVNSSIYE